jgi:hypothetical protein
MTKPKPSRRPVADDDADVVSALSGFDGLRKVWRIPRQGADQISRHYYAAGCDVVYALELQEAEDAGRLHAATSALAERLGERVAIRMTFGPNQKRSIPKRAIQVWPTGEDDGSDDKEDES